MYNFKKRVGLAIGTANPNDEDIQNTATGLGGLILRSDLYNKALTGANNNKLENFDSFVVTNPDLVDEGIDISGLRTTTDTSPYLLGNIPDYGGIQYEAYNPNRLSDLMRLYSGGFPMLDTPQAAPDFTGGQMIDTGGGGGMDQVTSGLDLGGNTDFEQSLLDQGIGVQGAIGDPVVAPGEIPVTQQEMDDFNAIPVTPQTFADTGRQDLLDQAGNVEDIGYATDYFPEYDFGPQPGISNPRAPGQDTVTQDTTAMDTTPSAPPGILNPYQEPMTQQDLIDSDANVGFGNESFKTVSEIEANDPNFRYRDQFMEDIRGLPQDIKDRFNEIKESPLGQGISNFKNYLMDKGGQQVANNVIKFGDTTIDIAKSLTSGAISIIGKALTGIPGLGLLASLLPEGGRSDLSNRLGEQYGMDDIGRLTGGPMAGYAVDSLMGDGIEQATIDRINSIKNRTAPQTESSEKKIQELEEFLSEIDYLGGDPVGANTELDIATGNITGDASVAEDAEAGGFQGALDARDDLAGVQTGDAGVAEAAAAADRARDAAAAANAAATAAAQRELNRTSQYNRGDSGGGGSSSGGGGQQQSSGGGYNEGNFCFDPNTPIQMADGSNKKIKDIQLGDDTKGGEVTGVFQFKATDEIHDYKGVTVAGSHYVKEDGKFIMVQDSPLAVKIDKIPVVYSLDTTGRRIFIKDIEFADYNGDGIAKGFLHNAGVDTKGFDKEVLRQVEQRLI